jgi:hypothetical protein
MAGEADPAREDRVQPLITTGACHQALEALVRSYQHAGELIQSRGEGDGLGGVHGL